MTDDVSADRQGAAAPAAIARGAPSRLGRFAARFSRASVPFEMNLPDGAVQRFGQGKPGFRVTLKNRQALRAVTSLDEGRIGDAYVAGHIDIEGDMLRPFELRASMKDFHLAVAAWRFIQPLLFGQVHTNRQAITAHYDIDPEFFLSFLDPKTPCYTQGMYESPDETLEAATLRKFDWCYEKCHRSCRCLHLSLHGLPIDLGVSLSLGGLGRRKRLQAPERPAQDLHQTDGKRRQKPPAVLRRMRVADLRIHHWGRT